MKPLSKELRNKFERTIENAREIAEEAAKIALEQLGVGEASPYSYLSEDERALRRRLRAHGRNLGDVRDSKTEIQEIDRLVEEIAYEHWHRMLFARFLAENDLLMYYEDNDLENAVPVTLSECDELAQELGLKNGWEMAANIATKMLPQIFKNDAVIFKIQLPFEHLKKLRDLLIDLNRQIFIASDSIGWSYQYWQNKKKKIVRLKNEKIGSNELPAVTQLFTEQYMVDFLIDNSIGSWWAARKLEESNYKEKMTEDSIRDHIKLEGCTFSEIKFNKNSEECWVPVTGKYESWPDDISNFKLIDPSCGSGHFLIAAFDRLVPIRMYLENIDATEACDLVIKENIHGLEIDKRCVEIAVFALAFKAWKYPGARGFRILPEINIAWCGQSIYLTEKELMLITDNDEFALMQMHILKDVFDNANILGSLINPLRYFTKEILEENSLNKLEKHYGKKQYSDKEDFSVLAKGMAKALMLMSNKYHLVITNPPYLGERKQSDSLKTYIRKNYSAGKSDLATAFILRGHEFVYNGHQCLVLPQNWLYQKSYENLRKKLLKNKNIKFICQLGANSFETPIGADVILIILGDKNDKFFGLDLSGLSNIQDKKTEISSMHPNMYSTEDTFNNSEHRIILQSFNDKIPLLEDYATSYVGILNGDSKRFICKYWETLEHGKKWEYLQSTVSSKIFYGGRDNVILWEQGNGELRALAIELKERLHNADTRGNQAWKKQGIAVSQMGDLPCTLYTGEKFDSNCAVIIPKNIDYLQAIWEFCNSDNYKEEVRKIDKKRNITNATLVKVPFDYEYWKIIADEKYYDNFLKPYTNDPTQWIFHGHPSKSADPLQVAIARLLGYRWPAELDDEMELSDEAKALVEETEGLLSFADKDGIVCIPSVRGEAPASERLLNILAAAYKDEDINTILPGLLSDADHAGKSLESWLRDKFFTQHYKLFGHRPFIWQIWDGLKDGFSALVNYHKLDRKNLETLIYTYLGDWISKQKSAMVDGIEGAEEKLNAAISLKKKLELILEGEAPYDIFVRWKPLNKQPLGWEPDLNDGVRINIRPFMSVGDVGKKGAGVLRDKPNIKWTKDRGKDTENSPWYHLFSGDRINDHHVTLEEKKKAREEMR